MQVVRNLGIVLLGLGLVLSAATSASAAAFNRTHPRRAEVNHRLAIQNARIHHGVKEGTITPQEATQLHAEDRSVRAEERADAAQHDGHITKAEQRDLNQDENAVSRDIYNAAH
jgi:homoaconitase/3-isopropylmalate dehydratase large subunit